MNNDPTSSPNHSHSTTSSSSSTSSSSDTLANSLAALTIQPDPLKLLPAFSALGLEPSTPPSVTAPVVPFAPPQWTTRQDIDKFTAFADGTLAPLKEPFTLTSTLKRIRPGTVPTGFPFIDRFAMFRVGFAGPDVTLYVLPAAPFVYNRDELHRSWHASLAQAVPTILTSAGLSLPTSKTLFVSEDWNLDSLTIAFRHTFGNNFTLIAFKTGQRSASIPCEHLFNLAEFERIYLHLAVTFYSTEEDNSVVGWPENNPQFRAFWAPGTSNWPTTIIDHMNRSSKSAPRNLAPAHGLLTYHDWKVYENWIRLFRRNLSWFATRRAAANTGNFDRRAQLAATEMNHYRLVMQATDQVMANDFGARIELGMSFSPAELDIPVLDVCALVWTQLRTTFSPFLLREPITALAPMCAKLRDLSQWTTEHNRRVFSAFVVRGDDNEHSLLTNPDWLGLESIAVMESLLQAITTGDHRKMNPYNPTFRARPLHELDALIQRFFTPAEADQPPTLRLEVAHHPSADVTCWQMHGGQEETHPNFVTLWQLLPKPHINIDNLLASLCAICWDAFLEINDANLANAPLFQAYVNRETVVHYVSDWVFQSVGRGRGGNNQLQPLLNKLSALAYRVTMTHGLQFMGEGLNPELERRVKDLLLEHFPITMTAIRRPGGGAARRVPVTIGVTTCFYVQQLVDAHFNRGTIAPVPAFIFPPVEQVSSDESEPSDGHEPSGGENESEPSGGDKPFDGENRSDPSDGENRSESSSGESEPGESESGESESSGGESEPDESASVDVIIVSSASEEDEPSSENDGVSPDRPAVTNDQSSSDEYEMDFIPDGETPTQSPPATQPSIGNYVTPPLQSRNRSRGSSLLDSPPYQYQLTPGRGMLEPEGLFQGSFFQPSPQAPKEAPTSKKAPSSSLVTSSSKKASSSSEDYESSSEDECEVFYEDHDVFHDGQTNPSEIQPHITRRKLQGAHLIPHPPGWKPFSPTRGRKHRARLLPGHHQNKPSKASSSTSSSKTTSSTSKTVASTSTTTSTVRIHPDALQVYFDRTLDSLLVELRGVYPDLPPLLSTTVATMRTRIGSMSIDLPDATATMIHYEAVIDRAITWYLRRHYSNVSAVAKRLNTIVVRSQKRCSRLDLNPSLLGNDNIFSRGRKKTIIAFKDLD